jgi:hypothetical protein
MIDLLFRVDELVPHEGTSKSAALRISVGLAGAKRNVVELSSNTCDGAAHLVFLVIKKWAVRRGRPSSFFVFLDEPSSVMAWRASRERAWVTVERTPGRGGRHGNSVEQNVGPDT